MQLVLSFDKLILSAALNNSPIALKLAGMLPLEINLQTWGHEVYGSISHDLGVHQPQARVPDGALAYTNQGNYFCVFFGQQPAWPVEIIGLIADGDWQQLQSETQLKRLKIEIV